MGKIADRVKETTVTAGTGPYTLAGAAAGFRSFASAVTAGDFADGDDVEYCATDGTSWEVGHGVFSVAGNTVARTTIRRSSNAGSAVNWAAGSKDIWCNAPAALLAPVYSASGVLFADANGAIAQDGTKFCWDNTNKRLGLGTATPNQQLELTANMRVAATSIFYTGASTLLHTKGGSNVCLGADAGNLTLSGSDNIAIGGSAGTSISSGSSNTVVGASAGSGGPGSGSQNTLIGANTNLSLFNSTNRTAIGYGVTNSLNNSVAIGNSQVVAWYPIGSGVVTLGLNGNSFKGLYFDYTNTAVGTTGNKTINKPAGRVNIAAGGTAVTVTNSRVTADSLVQAWCMTNDGTAYVKNVVPAAGSFTVNLGAAATAEVAIGFLVINTD